MGGPWGVWGGWGEGGGGGGGGGGLGDRLGPPGNTLGCCQLLPPSHIHTPTPTPSNQWASGSRGRKVQRPALIDALE